MSATARELTRRLWVLLVLAALATLALFGSCQGLFGTAGPLRETTAPAVLAVDTAQEALNEAGQESADPAASGDFRNHITIANQSLDAVAAEDVTGTAGRQTLKTVTGLITVYTNFVLLAHQETGDKPLHDGYLHYADQVLSGDEGITDLLGGLQAEQRAEVRRQTDVGAALWVGWGLTLLLSVALLGALADTHRYLRQRFKHRWNRPLLGAGVLVTGGVTVLAVFAALTSSVYDETRDRLGVGAQDPGRIQQVGETVSRSLASSGFRAGLSWWILVLGLVLLALIVAGLWPRLNDYRFRRTR
jgi:hypothetical protein